MILNKEENTRTVKFCQLFWNTGIKSNDNGAIMQTFQWRKYFRKWTCLCQFDTLNTTIGWNTPCFSSNSGFYHTQRNLPLKSWDHGTCKCYSRWCYYRNETRLLGKGKSLLYYFMNKQDHTPMEAGIRCHLPYPRMLLTIQNRYFRVHRMTAWHGNYFRVMELPVVDSPHRGPVKRMFDLYFLCTPEDTVKQRSCRRFETNIKHIVTWKHLN